MAAVFQHTLVKIESTRERLTKAGKWEEHMKKKDILRHQNKRKILASVAENVKDYDDVTYVGNVKVGTPGQNFVVVFDTATANFWVPDVTCAKNNSDCAPYCSDKNFCKFVCDLACCTSERTAVSMCGGKNKFDSTKSTTYVKNGKIFSINYRNFNLEGFLGQDALTLPGNKGMLVIPQTVFGQVQQISSTFENQSFDGVVGFAYPLLAIDQNYPPLWNADRQNLLDNFLFSVYFKHGVKKGDIGGVFTFGAYDKDNCGPIFTSVRIKNNMFWEIPIDSIFMKTAEFYEEYNAIYDTSNPFIIAPPNIAEAFANVSGATFDEKQKAYTISCSTSVPNMDISIKKNLYTINGEKLIVDIGIGNNQCLFLVNGGELEWGISFIFGIPFLQSYCHSFNIDDHKIEFALLKN